MTLSEVLRSARRLALLGLACLFLALPVAAGDGGDGGWINLPGSVGGPGNPINGPETQIPDCGARLVVTGHTARAVLGNNAANGAGIQGNFSVSLRASALLSGDRAFVEVGRGMVGGLGVLQVAGLPPVPFLITGERIDLPIQVFQALTAAGHPHVTLRLLTPTMDHLVSMDFDFTHLVDVQDPRLSIVGRVL